MLTYLFSYFAMFALASFARYRVANWLFFAGVFLFVACRFETGFDWPVYKGMFQDFQNDFAFSRLLEYQEIYSQELGFLLLVGLSAAVFPSYEVFQALVSVVFLVSIWRLSSAFKVTNVALVVALAFSYLLLTVGFSTVRQSFAIAVFNFGLIAMVRGCPRRGIVLFVMAAMVQVSALIYIFAFIISRSLLMHNRPPGLRAMIALASSAFVMVSFLLPMVASSVPFVADRFAYYAEYFESRIEGVGLWSVLYFVTFLCVSAHVSYGRGVRRVFDGPDLLLRSLVVVLCAIAIAAEFFPIIRDRASYEMWILYSIYLANESVSWKWQARFAAFAFGIVFTFLNVLSYPGVMAFVPYENVVVCGVSDCENSGPDRQVRLNEELDELLRR